MVIELYGENMVGVITVVVIIEKPKVLAWESSWEPSCGSNHESNAMATQSGICRIDSKYKGSREGGSGASRGFLEADRIGVESMTILLFWFHW
jgi:hypothetical protein